MLKWNKMTMTQYRNNIDPKDIKEIFNYTNNELYWKTQPGSVKVYKPAGYINNHNGGYRVIRINNVEYLAHRLIWCYHYGTWPTLTIDHKDNNRSNNNIDNLREATFSEQRHNSKLRNDNTSGVKGISWHKSDKKWRANITINKKQIYIGSFSTIEEAEVKITAAREILHKKFANHG